MINIEEYPILKNHIATLKETSLDDGGSVAAYMTDSQIEVVDFDKVKDDYAGNLHLPIRPQSNDALHIALGSNDTFIEFKNGSLRYEEKRKEVRRKVYDSVLMLTDIIGENISYTRKHLNYILVYNETKNPDDENIDVKTAVQESQAREEISKSVFRLAQERKILFGLERFKGYCFKEVATYSKEEFEQEFVAKISS